MIVKKQNFYDVYLDYGDELGKELMAIFDEEKKQNKQYNVVVHQVIKVNTKQYTVIINILER